MAPGRRSPVERSRSFQPSAGGESCRNARELPPGPPSREHPTRGEEVPARESQRRSEHKRRPTTGPPSMRLRDDEKRPRSGSLAKTVHESTDESGTFLVLTLDRLPATVCGAVEGHASHRK